MGTWSVFRDVPLPDGSTTRVMNKKVFNEALDAAEKKLVEVLEEMRKLDDCG